MALSALREGDLRAAAAIAKRLLDNKPDDPAVHQLVSICDIAVPRSQQLPTFRRHAATVQQRRPRLPRQGRSPFQNTLPGEKFLAVFDHETLKRQHLLLR
jgi:hypothetical protein